MISMRGRPDAAGVVLRDGLVCWRKHQPPSLVEIERKTPHTVTCQRMGSASDQLAHIPCRSEILQPCPQFPRAIFAQDSLLLLFILTQRLPLGLDKDIHPTPPVKGNRSPIW